MLVGYHWMQCTTQVELYFVLVSFYARTVLDIASWAQDKKGNRYCINLVSVAGMPPTV